MVEETLTSCGETAAAGFIIKKTLGWNYISDRNGVVVYTVVLASVT
jgi:hypothetical protein